MKNQYILISSILTATITLTLFNCVSSNGLEQEPPVGIGDTNYQRWTAGVKGGGSGIDLYIPLKSELPDNIKLDSVYFKEMVVKLEKKDGEQTMYIGHFKLNHNSANDIVLSSDPADEFKNKPPILKVKPPIKINENDCLVSFSLNGKTSYFKINDIEEKESLKYPRARRN